MVGLRRRGRCDECKAGRHCGGDLCECCNVPVNYVDDLVEAAAAYAEDGAMFTAYDRLQEAVIVAVTE